MISKEGDYMKITINYDFFDALLNVNSGMTPMKVIRNNKKIIGVWYLPVLTVLNYSACKNWNDVFKLLVFEFGLLVGSVMFYYITVGIDDYKNKSIGDLKELVYKFHDININTDYNLLKNSELIKRKYKVSIDKKNLLTVIESKYFSVPIYDFNSNIKNIGILQEHPVGTSDYVLSIGSPKKELKLAHASI